uniref:Band_3_cyto domain-containing protein n=1 Tax=Wuchereria bancrofti TaxID=6293 RepID=A0A1I8EAA2_WUCBA
DLIIFKFISKILSVLNFQIFVGVIPNLTKTYFVMLRLSEATVMPEILDGEVPLRFAVVILGPGQPDVSYHEVGRSIATLMTNTEFNAIAYEANVREELICGVDNFLDDSVVIPPGEIDNKRLLSGDEIRKALKKRQNRRKLHHQKMNKKMTLILKDTSKKRKNVDFLVE